MGIVDNVILTLISAKMTNFQAFCSGFWSVLDFARPFDERPKFREPEASPIDSERLQEKLELGKSVWDSVGGYFNVVGSHLYSAMEEIDKELETNGRNILAR